MKLKTSELIDRFQSLSNISHDKTTGRIAMAVMCNIKALEELYKATLQTIENTKVTLTKGGEQKLLYINESNLYKTIFQSRKESAERFTEWVTSEVLPSIRKTGSYSKPLTTSEQIRLLAQGNTELTERVDKVEDKITSIEEETPLYGCEIEEVQKHVRKKGIEVLGGKDSNAYKDGGIRGSVYSDIYKQLKREFGCVATYKSIKRKYLADVHEFIDTYLLPIALAEVVHDTNM